MAAREHNDGSAGRAFTPDQKAAVLRVRKCSPTAFYDILGLEAEKTSVTDAGIKKAYRKQSLLTHPDKNGYTGADEAFKLVSRAFQTLSDPDKKAKFDKFGVDPDSRFGGGGAAASGASPFAGFSGARSRAGPMGGRGGMFEEEISPEELFRQFFGGGLGGGGLGGPFGGGPFGDGGFVFNMGGGPGVRVHQFGGGRPRRRPASANGQAEQPTSATQALQNLLPLLVLFVIPLLSSLFSGSGSTPSVPKFSLDNPLPPRFTQHHTSANHKIAYYVDPADVKEYTPKKWRTLDQAAERTLVNTLDLRCQSEENRKLALAEEARGWFSVDQEKMDEARAMKQPSCERLDAMGFRRR